MKPKRNRRKKNKKITTNKRYSNIVKKYILPSQRYIITALLVAFVVRIFITLTSGALVAMAKVGGYDWLIAVVTAGLYGFLEYKTNNNTKLKFVVIYSAVMGMLFGGIIALIDLLVIRDLWALFNIIKKPVIMAVLFSAVSTIGFVLNKNGN